MNEREEDLGSLAAALLASQEEKVLPSEDHRAKRVLAPVIVDLGLRDNVAKRERWQEQVEDLERTAREGAREKMRARGLDARRADAIVCVPRSPCREPRSAVLRDGSGQDRFACEKSVKDRAPFLIILRDEG